MRSTDFDAAFQALTGAPPFPWQVALHERFLAGAIPRALDLPTGLGKTSVMAIWLLARAAKAPVPQRLVYVVDRRAVVDQATSVAERLRERVNDTPGLQAALGLDGRELPISTLRGKHLDNREWLDDPSIPAIVVGTVDMIGSRLLFEGYGVSRKMRPYHAGFLGVDTLLVLDEAHLVPPFERLAEAIVDGRENKLGPVPDVSRWLPALRLLSLSATGRAVADRFTLTPADFENVVVQDRLRARKIIEVRPEVGKSELAERLAQEVHTIVTEANEPRRIVVFCDLRSDATKVAELLRKRTKLDVELFVGGRRAWERTNVERWLTVHGYLAGTRRPAATVILVATSAAEVGVDLDADVAVADVVAWERMVQRLGRVNRRGVDPDDATRKINAPVVLVPLADAERAAELRAASLALLDELPALAGGRDGSPGALVALRERADQQSELRALLDRATTPAPLHPPLERPLVDAWAMTSLESHSGRPEIAPWLRGWIDDDEPQVKLAFRDDLPIDGTRAIAELDAFLDVAGPHAAEELETEVRRALEWLTTRLEAYGDAQAKVNAPDARRTVLALALDRHQEPKTIALATLEDKKERERLERHLAGGHLLVDARVGGLEHGMLVEAAALPAADARSLDLTKQDGSADHGDGVLPFRVRRTDVLHDDAATSGLRLDKAFVVERDPEGDPKAWLVVERRSADPISEAGRSIARHEQGLEQHQDWVKDQVSEIAARLGLDAHLTRLICIAGRLHDEGKRARRWQRAFHAAPDRPPIAKSTRAPNVKALGGYRHELGSLQHVERDPEFADLDAESRDLVLHLVAAHHGRARPVLPVDGAEEPPAKLHERAREVALRFDRLSRRFGPWGLAWLESLLRAADVRASRKNDEGPRG